MICPDLKMKTQLALLYCCLLLLGVHRSQSANIYGNGTFVIGGFFNMKGASQQVNPQIGIHFVEAFRFALHMVNKNSSIMYGFKFSEDIKKDELVYETNDGGSLVNKILYGFFVGRRRKQAAIAPYGSHDSYELGIVTDGLKYPLVSYSASFEITKDDASIFSRTVPEDSFRVMAIVDVIKRLRWNFIVIVSSNERDGDNAARQLIKKIGELRICIYSYTSLQEVVTDDEYTAAIREASGNAKAKGLVLFTNIVDSLGLIKAMRALNQTRRFQILAASGFTNYVELTRGNEDILEGSISLEHATEEIPAFREYFISLNLTTSSYPQFQEFWEQTFQCSVKGENGTRRCTGDEKLEPGVGYFSNTPVHLIINLVYTLAYMFRSVIEDMCRSRVGYCYFRPSDISRYLKPVKRFMQSNSFPDCTLNITDPITSLDPYLVKYDVLNYIRRNNSFVNRKLGGWSFRRDGWNRTGRYYLDMNYTGTLVLELANLTWKGNSSVLTSSCRERCPVGYVKRQSSDYRLAKCCWSCIKCPDSDIVRNGNCNQCDRGTKPNSDRTKCTKLRTESFRTSSQGKLILHIYMGIASSGIACTTFVIALFIKKNQNSIVRASGRELCYFMLVGIILTFLVPFTFYLEPSPIVCSIQIVLPGIALCISYSPLFLKTNRIYRIFCNAQKSVSRPHFITPKSQLLLLLFIICIQMLLGVVWIVSSRPEVQKFYPIGQYVILHCDEDGTKLILNLLFSVIFMICCTWYAFKTRNFPKNYNESKYIGFTMYITCICWAVFLPMYFILEADETYIRVHLLCVNMMCIGFLNLFGLFGQKIRLIMCPSLVGEQNAQVALSQASHASVDVRKNHQAQIQRIDPLALCKELSSNDDRMVVTNRLAIRP